MLFAVAERAGIVLQGLLLKQSKQVIFVEKAIYIHHMHPLQLIVGHTS